MLRKRDRTRGKNAEGDRERAGGKMGEVEISKGREDFLPLCCSRDLSPPCHVTHPTSDGRPT